ncbi:hypothetical protein [Ruegeria arenilitoris]|uniref:hypothetical protein n=1 Tax=Ruegeria arenilitoris TaxID=1173585 RepID=UPI001480E597|nr:hypothetical protein [Ruegeria arenilitoris]
MPKNKDATEKPDKGKTNTSLRLDGKTLKALKIRAIEEGTSVQKIVETLVNDYLDASRKGQS